MGKLLRGKYHKDKHHEYKYPKRDKALVLDLEVFQPFHSRTPFFNRRKPAPFQGGNPAFTVTLFRLFRVNATVLCLLVKTPAPAVKMLVYGGNIWYSDIGE
jgi:hypothetical protein